MKCPKCRSEVTMNAGLVVTCFMCGATIQFHCPDPDTEDVFKRHPSRPATHRQFTKTHPRYKKADRRLRRILQMLALNKERVVIAKAVKCSAQYISYVAWRLAHGYYQSEPLSRGSSRPRLPRDLVN